ncbi:unnamed protein product [Porites lobata]|uniref:Uncharacterized protein n=1 Tax=Porites lobata TaxID=104759 RepID=A0ABN8S2Q9_9CNID|nr:unnamed protein product [Porites lobata]
MHALAAFRESENDKLQEFADLCADVTSQISCLPGLACLNFPNAIQPIAGKLPPSLRGKWEKELAKFSENNGDAYPGFHRPKSICRVYAIIDDQSNSSLITSELADELGATGPEEKYYLTTCSGEKEAKYGRRVTGVVLKSLKGTESELPTLVECTWTIIGQMCLDLVGGPVHVRACRTSLLAAGPGEKSTETNNYEFLPCPNQFTVKESFLEQKRDITDNVFITSREDNDVSLSCEDRKFLDIMETGVHKNEQGNWEMPLPFLRKDPHLPNNRSQAKASDGKGLRGVHGEDHRKRPRLPGANRRNY